MPELTDAELDALMPGAREMEELRQELLAEGNTEDEVRQYMADLRTLDFERVNAQWRAEGKSDEWIVQRWHDFQDALPKDDPDTDDYEVER